LRSSEADALVIEVGNELERAAQCFDIASHGSDQAIIEVGSGLQSRHIGLIDVGSFCELHLGLTRRFAQRFQREAHATCGPQAPAEHAHGFDFM